MAEKRQRAFSRGTLRALKQYRDLSDAEFDEIYQSKLIEKGKSEDSEEKYNELMHEFEGNYDLSEMLPNDKIVLDNIITATLRLRKYEAILDSLPLSLDNILIIEKTSSICGQLRNDIIKMEDSLKISRKTRKSEKEQDAVSKLIELQQKAKKFALQKMQWIICEKCGLLLANVWWLYPTERGSKITVRCHHEVDGVECGWEKTFTSKELVELGGRNKEDIPESLR